jgi:signal transduction histidine kinase
VSLRVTLLLAFAYALLIVLIALELPLALNLSNRVEAEVRAESATQVALVATSAAGELDRRAELRELVEEAAEGLGGRVIATDADGIVVADSAGRGLEGSDYSDRPEIAQALRGETAQGRRESASLGEELLFTAAPVLERGRVVGVVRATQSVAAVDREIREDILVLIAVGVVALLFGVGVAWLLAGFLTRPLQSLAGAARRVAEGDLGARAPVAGSREQRDVAETFNEMAARLEAVLTAQREFVANASHQLRTPLTGLRLRLEAAEDLARGPELREELAAAGQEVERLAALLRNLLVLAREGEERPEPRPVGLGEEATEALARWSAEAQAAGIRLAARDEGVPAALASASDVGIALDNLLENAIKYSPRGSTVTVEWGERDGCAYVAVTDEGPGLAPGEGAAATERFFRGSAGARTQGSGLGLAIVRSLAQRWGGELALANRERGGLRAEVRLPSRDAEAGGAVDFAKSLPGRR